MFRRCVAALLAACLHGSVAWAQAADSLLIWAPVKNTDTSYAARFGFRVPGWTFASAGVELGVNAASLGGTFAVPINLWGKLTAQSLQSPAVQFRRDIDMRMNAETGSAAAQLNERRQMILSEDLDLSLSRHLALSYDVPGDGWSGLEVQQSLKLSSRETATSLAIRTRAVDSFRRLGAGLSLEQKFGRALRLSGELSRTADDTTVRRVDLRYQVRW